MSSIFVSAGALASWLAVITSDGPGGSMARRLLPAAPGVPVVLGWLTLLGQRAGPHETEFSVSLVITLSIVIFGAVVWISARSLDRQAVEREREAVERESAQAASRESEAKFQELLDVAPDGIVIADRDGRIVLVNAQTERLFGYTRDELLEHPVESLLPERMRGGHVGHRRGYHAAARTRPMGSGLDLLGRRKDGSEFPVEISLSPLETEDGLLVTAIIRDVSERKRAEEEIRRRHREAAELAGSARALTETLDIGEVGRRTVERVMALFGGTFARLDLLLPDDSLRALASAGRAPDHRAPDSPLPPCVAMIGRAVAEGKAVWSPDQLDEPGNRLDDEVRRSLETQEDRAILCVPLRGHDAVIGCLSVGDRTGRSFTEAEITLLQTFADQAALALENARLFSELEERVVERTTQLAAANKELEAFAYSVSHDLRAPLRAIDGFARILVDRHGPQLPEEARRHLRLVRDNVQQMGQLINDLLTFSRLGRQAVEKRAVAPAALAREALADLGAEQAGRRVEIAIGDLPVCRADGALLKLVFVNLLSNALKFTRARDVARIEVGCRRQEGEVVYAVRDNGVGFDMRYADKLFGAFQRLHRAEEYEGAGVGLAIVQRIVHRHGGRVWAEGTIGEGASIFFTLEEGTG